MTIKTILFALLFLSGCTEREPTPEEADKAVQACDAKNMDARLYRSDQAWIRIECVPKRGTSWSTNE